MKNSVVNGDVEQQWLHNIVWLAVLLMISADLKVTVYPYIHWLVFGAVLISYIPFLFEARFALVPSAYLGYAVFVLAVFINGLTGSLNPGYDLAQGLKLTVVMCALFFFVGSPAFATAGFQAFCFSVWVNVIFIIGGLLGFTALAAEMSPGRWGTFLNYPGSLWKAGMDVFIYAVFLSFTSSRRYRYLLLLGASLAVIYFDGSRTAFIFLPLGGLYILFILKTSKATKMILVFETGLLSLLVFLFYLKESFSAGFLQNLLPGVSRSSELLSRVYSDGITGGLLQADSVRFEMLQSVVNAIQHHPGFGTGINSTTADTLIGPMVVHNTYLQVWADLGPVAFLSYLWIAFGWIPWLPKALRKIEAVPEAKKQAVYYNAVFCLGVFAISGLFHPLSTEWSEWILYIIPCALYWEIVLTKQHKGQAHA